MGLFDEFRDGDGRLWQTKALECTCEVYEIGAKLPSVDEVETYQVAIYGDEPLRDSLATVEDEHLIAVDTPRNPALKFVDYYGSVSRFDPHFYRGRP